MCTKGVPGRSPVLWIAVATCLVFGLSAGAASAQPNLIEICHKGKNLKVNVHAVPALLLQGARLGSCEGEVCGACSLQFDPVTCSNGKTYANECFAECDGATGCTRLGICSNIYDPVTCTAPDGSTQTYANRCQAQLAGATACGVVCACDQSYAPVRCSNGTVYVNSCIAECSGQSGCVEL